MASNNSSGSLPSLPRIFVASSYRARLAHRRPISIPLPTKLTQTTSSHEDGEKLQNVNSSLEQVSCRVSPVSDSAAPSQCSVPPSTLECGSDLALVGEQASISSAYSTDTLSSPELTGNAPAASVKEELSRITSRSPYVHALPSALPKLAEPFDNSSNDSDRNPNLILSESYLSDSVANGDSQREEATRVQKIDCFSLKDDSEAGISPLTQSWGTNIIDANGIDGQTEISPQRQSPGTNSLISDGASFNQDDATLRQNQVLSVEVADGSKNPGSAAEESEPEEGQLPGEWSGTDESEEENDRTSDEKLEGCSTLSFVGEEGITVAQIARHRQTQFQLGNDFSFPSCPTTEPARRSSRKTETVEKKRKKHKKGQGAKKRAREKSAQKYKEKKQRLNASAAEQQGESSVARLVKGDQPKLQNSRRKNVETVSQVPSAEERSDPKAEVVEEGEITEPTETGTGLLSSLVEDEVGLWTIDAVDDQLVAQMEKDVAVKKKRGPDTAERILKRKIAKKKKRAQKEKELGIRKRRPRDNLNKPPPKVLCTHFMKGRCAKGDSCPFSHDAIPLTKQEPCKFLMSRSCLKGDGCPFSHDLKAFPCKFFHTRGLCYDGDNCLFSHRPITEEEREKLQQRVEKDKERGTNAATFDLPPPSFSSSLPDEEDPDPFGWGTANACPSFDLDLHNPDQTNPEAMGATPKYNFEPEYGNISGTSWTDRSNEMPSYPTVVEEAQLQNNADDHIKKEDTYEKMVRVDIQSGNLENKRFKAVSSDTTEDTSASSAKDISAVTFSAPILLAEKSSLLVKRGLDLKRFVPSVAQTPRSRKLSVESLFGEILKQ
ncbi:hypothetical protein R1flu_028904 [Riccia fluitans]|uniref:C3H1-type domain-containing protein n=1 Tax=Riccia fluitans TaxID=41844 RepID=A0ABD1XR06_9MARC